MVLTEKGFKRPTFEELLNRQMSRAKQLFGEDIDLSSQSILGKYIRINVYDLAECYELLEDIYYSRFPNSARGQSLDRLCTFANVVRNPDTAAKIKVKFYGKAGATINAGCQITNGTVIFYVIQDSAIEEDGTGIVDALCTKPGALKTIGIKDEFTLVNPQPDISGISILELVETGQNREDDTALRFRFGKAVAGSGSGTANAIEGAISRVALVEGITIVENDTEEMVDGRPPHTFECFVLAPESQDTLIAEAIFSKKPLGIKSCGSVLVEVLDRALKTHKVYFSRTLKKQIYAIVYVKTNQFFENDGIIQIKSNLAGYINNLVNGESVYISGLFGYIHSVHGVVNVLKLELSEDGIDFSTSDVEIGANEIARILDENIEVRVII